VIRKLPQQIVDMNHSLLAFHPANAVDHELGRQEPGSAFSVATHEMKLATELLEHAEEGGLDAYLVEMIDQAHPDVRPNLTTPLAALLSQTLRYVLAAPSHERAGHVFALELEGLSHEDQVFEMARHFARYASEAMRLAAGSIDEGSAQEQAARAANTAASLWAPGLVDPGHKGRVMASPGRQSGPLHGLHSSPPNNQEHNMHDFDSETSEYDMEAPAFEAEPLEFGENEWQPEESAVLGEDEEEELASELLEVANEEELDQFIGKLIRRRGHRGRHPMRSPLGRAIGGVLRSVARRALPLAGVGADVALGARIGSGVASAADTADADGDKPPPAQDDPEFEGATRFVRIAANTLKDALTAHPHAEPRAVAQAAAQRAARLLAPRLLTTHRRVEHDGRPDSGPAMQGRWERRGDAIVLFGA